LWNKNPDICLEDIGMASRISRTACEDYQTIEPSDVRQAFVKFNPKATALKPRRKVGFSA